MTFDVFRLRPDEVIQMGCGCAMYKPGVVLINLEINCDVI